MLLNGHSKRFYQYKNPKIFPETSFEDLNENRKEFIDKLFSKYCLNDENEIQETINYKIFVSNILADIDIKNISPCGKKIVRDKDNFNEILKIKRNIGKLPLLRENEILLIFNNRCYEFLTKSNLLNNSSDDLFSLLNEIKKTIEENEIKHFDELNNLMIEFNNRYISDISEFIQHIQKSLTKQQLKRFKMVFKRFKYY